MITIIFFSGTSAENSLNVVLSYYKKMFYSILVVATYIKIIKMIPTSSKNGSCTL